MKIVIWKHVLKYMWVKEYVKIPIMLFKNWKLFFEIIYQTPPYILESCLCLTRIYVYQKKKKKLIYYGWKCEEQIGSRVFYPFSRLATSLSYLVLALLCKAPPHLVFSHFVVFRESLFRQVLLTSQAKEKSILVKSLISTMIYIYIYIFFFSSLIFSYSEPIKSICLFSWKL